MIHNLIISRNVLEYLYCFMYFTMHGLLTLCPIEWIYMCSLVLSPPLHSAALSGCSEWLQRPTSGTLLTYLLLYS